MKKPTRTQVEALAKMLLTLQESAYVARRRYQWNVDIWIREGLRNLARFHFAQMASVGVSPENVLEGLKGKSND